MYTGSPPDEGEFWFGQQLLGGKRLRSDRRLTEILTFGRGRYAFLETSKKSPIVNFPLHFEFCSTAH